jgi:hypothetical protein
MLRWHPMASLRTVTGSACWSGAPPAMRVLMARASVSTLLVGADGAPRGSPESGMIMF